MNVKAAVIVVERGESVRSIRRQPHRGEKLRLDFSKHPLRRAGFIEDAGNWDMFVRINRQSPYHWAATFTIKPGELPYIEAAPGERKHRAWEAREDFERQHFFLTHRDRNPRITIIFPAKTPSPYTIIGNID